jgi:hypothetical protein
MNNVQLCRVLYSIWFMIIRQSHSIGNKTTLLTRKRIEQYCYLDEREILGKALHSFLNKRFKTRGINSMQESCSLFEILFLLQVPVCINGKLLIMLSV